MNQPDDCARLPGCEKLIGIGGHARQVLLECGDVFVVAIGSNGQRAYIAHQVEALMTLGPGERFPWEIGASQSAYEIAVGTEIGRGTVILAGALIGNNVKLGKHCILNHQCTVDHDVALGNFVHVAPGARVLGGAVVQDGALIGANAVVLPKAVVPAWGIVRANSVWPADYDYSNVMRGGHILKMQAMPESYSESSEAIDDG